MHTTERRPRVAIVQCWVTHYRSGFYERLRDDLDAAGIELDLIHGRPPVNSSAGRKSDTIDMPGAAIIDNRRIGIGERDLFWQPALGLTRDADLVIVEQATKNLLNYALLLRQALGGAKVAMWGHGRNFQPGGASSVGEAIKRVMSRRAHWWFAYNDLSARVVAELGYPSDRITVVQNAIDTRALREARDQLPSDAVAELRSELGITGDHVGLFCGALWPPKRAGFMIEAARHVRARIPDFEFVVVGAGEDLPVVQRAAAGEPWIHVVGPRFDAAKAPYFELADVFFLPGLVGLAILDSFVFEVPLVASASAENSPEIDYLVDGRNGLLVEDAGDPRRYAAAVTELLEHPDRLNDLREGCRRSALRYTIEEMAHRYAEGVHLAIEAPARSGSRRRLLTRRKRDASRAPTRPQPARQARMRPPSPPWERAG